MGRHAYKKFWKLYAQISSPFLTTNHRILLKEIQYWIWYISAPTTVNLEPITDRTLKVTWQTPSDPTGITSYKAEVVNDNSKTCTPTTHAPGQLTCNIDQLDPYTEYPVRVLACRERDCSASGQVLKFTLPSSKSKHINKCFNVRVICDTLCS